MNATEYAFTCKVCGHSESWSTDTAAEAAAVWHVFTHHQGTWIEITGGRLPKDPKPENVGRKLEEWEQQL